jgi:hypothetical protein
MLGGGSEGFWNETPSPYRTAKALVWHNVKGKTLNVKRKKRTSPSPPEGPEVPGAVRRVPPDRKASAAMLSPFLV